MFQSEVATSVGEVAAALARARPGSSPQTFCLSMQGSAEMLHQSVVAQGCYRWLGRQLKGFEKASPKQLYRRFVETAGLVEVEADRVVVRLDRRSHNPILRAAALDRDAPAIPWLQNRKIYFLNT